MSAALLVSALAEPERVLALDAEGWTALLCAARAESLAGTLAARVRGLAVPPRAAAILADALDLAEQNRRVALWEAEMVARALAPAGIAAVLLKGTAYAAAGLSAAHGRTVGDCDVLVARGDLAAAETAFLAAGWEWVKADAYDDAYYRRWMHELPPLIHADRDRMLDVHHDILPLTARPRPDAGALLADAVPLERAGLSVLSPHDMIVHAAAHLFADGDLTGGLRNLWDVRCLLRDGGGDEGRAKGPAGGLDARAALHGLERETARAVRLARHLYAGGPAGRGDAPYLRRLLARDGWGRGTRPVTRGAFYVRSHWMRMPPGLLARHLWVKWRRKA